MQGLGQTHIDKYAAQNPPAHEPSHALAAARQAGGTRCGRVVHGLNVNSLPVVHTDPFIPRDSDRLDALSCFAYLPVATGGVGLVGGTSRVAGDTPGTAAAVGERCG